jgi:hypothetical protein
MLPSLLRLDLLSTFSTLRICDLSLTHPVVTSQAFLSLKMWGEERERGVRAGANKRIFWCHDFQFVIDWVGLTDRNSVRETLLSMYEPRNQSTSCSGVITRFFFLSLYRATKFQTWWPLSVFYLREEPTFVFVTLWRVRSCSCDRYKQQHTLFRALNQSRRLVDLFRYIITLVQFWLCCWHVHAQRVCLNVYIYTCGTVRAASLSIRLFGALA